MPGIDCVIVLHVYGFLLLPANYIYKKNLTLMTPNFKDINVRFVI